MSPRTLVCWIALGTILSQGCLDPPGGEEPGDGDDDVAADDDAADDDSTDPIVPLDPGAPELEEGPTSPWDPFVDRAPVAVVTPDDRVHVSWRLSAADDPDLGFHVYRRAPDGAPIRCNVDPILETTDYLDDPPDDAEYRWSVRPVFGGVEGPASEEVPLAEGHTDSPYVLIPLPTEQDGFYEFGLGELDGDGRLDLVVKQPVTSIDPYVDWVPSPETYTLTGMTRDGDVLWQYDMGWAIELGIWYSPFVVHDLDGDGLAEVVVKSGEGDPRDPDGKVTSGPEWLSILDGGDGAIVAQAPWPARDDFAYTRASRNQIGVAYLDGEHPHVIVERGTYGLLRVVAYRFDGTDLTEVWRWDNDGAPDDQWGQGAHWMLAADVDGDGRDEVILGSLVLDDDGTVLWTTGLGHPDQVYVGDLDPERPGWEVFFGVETAAELHGMCMVDAASGDLLWGYDQPTVHIHHGVCGDLTADEPGTECYGGDKYDDSLRWVWSADGDLLATTAPSESEFLRAFWDADLQHEIAIGGVVDRVEEWQGEILTTELWGSPRMALDLLGDWREEVITSRPEEIRIHTTPIPAEDRRPWLMQDAHYRMHVANGTSGYARHATLGFDLQSAP